uniref:D-glycero-D-manno-heptose 1-phosphate guanosyltransferase n=1 Tax=Rubrivivax gelatinosus S1 TaxID=1138313 RepID=L8BA03_RUBGE|nr:D-glycero-D-manno-heptose 1-phosphate guanosyltransferase [Rubrivivax gelatinosus S1]
MQAIVLAGGLGTRLRSAVPDLPKPMAPVAGRPFLAWILDRLVDAGFELAVLAVGYRHEAIVEHFGQRWRGLDLRYSVEREPLGTGGAIRLAASCTAARPVFVLNGDTFLQLDYAAMAAAHADGAERLSVAACPVDDVMRYGALLVEDGHVRGFREKGEHGPGLINAGTYLLGDEVLARIPAGRTFSLEQELLVPEIATLRPAAFVSRGLFIDIGVPEDWARAQTLLPAAASR